MVQTKFAYEKFAKQSTMMCSHSIYIWMEKGARCIVQVVWIIHTLLKRPDNLGGWLQPSLTRGTIFQWWLDDAKFVNFFQKFSCFFLTQKKNVSAFNYVSRGSERLRHTPLGTFHLPWRWKLLVLLLDLVNHKIDCEENLHPLK